MSEPTKQMSRIQNKKGKVRRLDVKDFMYRASKISSWDFVEQTRTQNPQGQVTVYHCSTFAPGKMHIATADQQSKGFFSSVLSEAFVHNQAPYQTQKSIHYLCQ